MVTAITRGELAALIPGLPAGEMLDWCELSAAGLAGDTVYANIEMLSRCRAAVSLSQESDTESNIQPKSNNEELHRQSGAEVDDPANARKSPKASRKTRS